MNKKFPPIYLTVISIAILVGCSHKEAAVDPTGQHFSLLDSSVDMPLSDETVGTTESEEKLGSLIAQDPVNETVKPNTSQEEVKAPDQGQTAAANEIEAEVESLLSQNEGDENIQTASAGVGSAIGQNIGRLFMLLLLVAAGAGGYYWYRNRSNA